MSGGGVLRVLLVEDDETIARALDRWLRRQGASVRVVADPLELEVALESFVPTLVVSDLNMPHRTGVEVLVLVKQLAPHARRVMLSGSLESLNAEHLAAIAPCRLVSKPWREETLADDLGLSETEEPS